MAQTACLLTAGYTLGCRDNTGGIKSIYIANWNGDITYTEVSNQITALTVPALYTLEYFKFDVVKQTCGLTETINSSVENGTIFWTQSLNIVFNKMDKDLRQQILLLCKATTTIIIEDLNGNYWLVGKVNGCDVTGGTAGTGTAYGDRNGYSLTLEAQEPDSVDNIAYSAFSTYIS